MNTPKFSPKKYLSENRNKLTLVKCVVCDGYKNMGLTVCGIIKQQPSGKFCIALFLVDRFCLGLKNCFVNFNLSENELTDYLQKVAVPDPYVEVSAEYFHNLIYASIDYANGLGFLPHQDFALAQLMLDDSLVNDGIDDIEVGKNGKPFFISGPHDNVTKIRATLDRTVGKGNYEYVYVD